MTLNKPGRKVYKIEIICAEDFADKGVEVLERISEMLDNIYGDAEWCASGGYVDYDNKGVNNDSKR